MILKYVVRKIILYLWRKVIATNNPSIELVIDNVTKYKGFKFIFSSFLYKLYKDNIKKRILLVIIGIIILNLINNDNNK